MTYRKKSTISNLIIIKCNSKDDYKQFYGGKRDKTTLKQDAFFRKVFEIDVNK